MMNENTREKKIAKFSVKKENFKEVIKWIINSLL